MAIYCSRVASVVLVLMLVGCATSEFAEPRIKQIWPNPPDPPRIAYVRGFSHPSDMGKKRNWFQWIFRVIFGEERAPHMLRPFGVAVDDRGWTYITDTGLQAVHIYNWARKDYRQIFWIERGRSRLISPAGVAVDEDYRVYVSDSQLNRIFVYGPKKFNLIATIGKSGQFERLGGLAYHRKDQRIYAVDVGAHRILVFDREGALVKTIGERGGGEGQFNFPSHIAIDSNGWLYVTDTMNFRIQIFDADGNFVNQFGRLGTTIGTFSKPKGIAVDSGGHIYVVDGIYDTVQIFDREGRLLLRFARTGEMKGNLWLPNGMFIDQRDRIYVADTYNQRVQVYQFLGSPRVKKPENNDVTN